MTIPLEVERANFNALVSTVCRLTSRWALHLSVSTDDPYTEIVKAAPMLTFCEHTLDGGVVLFFTDKIEAWRNFNLVVGDDGPTPTNPYDGPARVYALLVGPDGFAVTENT